MGPPDLQHPAVAELLEAHQDNREGLLGIQEPVGTPSALTAASQFRERLLQHQRAMMFDFSVLRPWHKLQDEPSSGKTTEQALFRYHHRTGSSAKIEA